MGGRLFVCVTCDRYASPAADAPSPGRALAGAVAARVRAGGEALTVRTVECLNGCPQPCTAALRMPGKCTIRFSGLTVEDAPALIQAAHDYAESADGNLPAEAMPARLRGKISLRVAPPASQAAVARSPAPDTVAGATDPLTRGTATRSPRRLVTREATA